MDEADECGGGSAGAGESAGALWEDAGGGEGVLSLSGLAMRRPPSDWDRLMSPLMAGSKVGVARVDSGGREHNEGGVGGGGEGAVTGGGRGSVGREFKRSGLVARRHPGVQRLLGGSRRAVGAGRDQRRAMWVRRCLASSRCSSCRSRQAWQRILRAQTTTDGRPQRRRLCP